MKNIFFNIILLTVVTSLLFAGEKKVLVEIFTNSHCSQCPIAHSALDNYLGTENRDKIEFIYYHMVFPYPTDELNLHNQSDAAEKYSFYGSSGTTPISFFNGDTPPSSYGEWKDNLDNLVQEESSFDISLSGNYTDSDFTISANIIQSKDNNFSNLTINFVVVEDVFYVGGNNISNHKNVMRKIVNPEGNIFSISNNESKNLTATIAENSVWDLSKIKVIVFIQDQLTKEVFQSESIAYSEFAITNVADNNIISNNFNLEQNYPNPFNPTTTIEYTIPYVATQNSLPTGRQVAQVTNLRIYDVLGREITTLVNKEQNPGKHRVDFNASQLANGVYYYQLKFGNLIQTKKMILLK